MAVIDLNRRRWKRYEENLLQKLMQFSRDTINEGAAGRGMELFWGEEGLAAEEFQDEASFARFFDWLIFDYRRNRRARRVIDRFREAVWAELGAEERLLLADWCAARLGVYEVVSVRPGEGLAIHDIFTGQRLDVEDPVASRALHKYDLLFTRPLKVDSIYSLSVAGLVIPRSWKRDLEVAVRRELVRYLRDHPEGGWDDLFRNRAHRINRFLVSALLTRRQPRLRTATGEALLVSRALFDATDEEAVMRALGQGEEFHLELEERDESGRLLRAIWSWVSHDHEDKDLFRSLMLGQVRLEGRRLWLKSFSRSRLVEGKRLLAARLGGLVCHRLDSYRAMDLQRPGSLAARHGERGTGEERAPEVAQVVQKFLDNYYRRWLDEPVPALGGRSPRQACDTGEGRAQVRELLKSLENLEERKRRAGEPYIEVDTIRRELGLPEEE